MKRIALILVGTLIVVALVGTLLLRFGLGASPGALFDVAGGMAAKLGCSGRYISGLSPAQIAADLESYSAAYGLVSINNIDNEGRVEAHLPPGATHSATFRDGIGCTLDIGDTHALDSINVPKPIQASTTPATAELNTLLQEQLATDNIEGRQTRALLVMHNNVIVGEANASGFDSTTPHLGWSMGKSVIAILLGRLEQQGKLDAQATALFPEWQDERQHISVADLLHMTSGLKFDETYLPGSDATRMLFNEYSAAAVARDQPQIHEPGSHFAYSSGTTNLLSRLLFERVGGSPAAAYGFLYSALLNPLGLAHTIVESDPSGVFVGSSYVYASARDWAAMGNLLGNKGMHNNQRLLDEDWIKRATTPNSSSNEPSYGYQLWLNSGSNELRWPDLPIDAYAMRGNRAQVVMVIPSRRAVFVRLGWSAEPYPTNKHFAALLEALPPQALTRQTASENNS